MRSQIEALTGKKITEIIDIPTQFNNDEPYPKQVLDLLAPLGINAEEWQTVPFLINPPSYNFGAVTLLAELHGRTGHFLPVIRVRPVPNSTPRRFEVAEIINLQTVRDLARQSRHDHTY